MNVTDLELTEKIKMPSWSSGLHSFNSSRKLTEWISNTLVFPNKIEKDWGMDLTYWTRKQLKWTFGGIQINFGEWSYYI